MYPRSIECHQRSVDCCVQIFGDHHGTTIQAKVNMGNSLNAQGSAKEARLLMEEAYASAIRVFGEKSSKTAIVLSIILATCGRLNTDPESVSRMKELLPLSHASYDYLLDAYGADHPDTLCIFGNLASGYGLSGDFDKCIQLFQKNIARFIELYGDDDVRTYDVKCRQRRLDIN